MKKVAVTRVDKNEFFSDEKELIILAPILTRCKTLRAAVMLQDWQLDPKVVETDGGLALASRSPSSRSRKIVSLHHFLIQRSFV